jgi:UDP-glucose 4-epimerase
MNIIITGGSGFIGSNLIKRLLNDNKIINILSIDNYLTGLKDNEIIDNRITYVCDSTWNINKRKKYSDFNPSLLYHFGEYSRIASSFGEPNMVMNYNLRGTFEVIEFCRNNNCKLIYSGSTSIFGNNMKDQHSSPYSWSKAKNIELIRNYKKWYNLDFVITYFSNVYGEGQIESGKYSTVIGIFKKQYENNEQITIVKPGTQTRDFTHINDTINAIIIASQKGEGDGYIIRTGIQYSILEVAKMFSTNYVLVQEQRGNRTESSGNMDKMLELGWKSTFHLKDYINRLTM